MQAALKDRASAVRITHRLTDSPACLVSDEHGMSTNLERMLKAAGQNVPALEAGARDQPGPPDRQAAEGRDATRRGSPTGATSCSTRRLLAEGGQLDDPASFVKRLNELMLALAGGPATTTACARPESKRSN